MSVALIDYGSGNLHSVEKALRYVAEGTSIRITRNPKDVLAADRVVLPGVGAFADCMAGLSGIPGMIDALAETVHEKKRPFLGICVGMQMLLDESHEHGIHQGLGWMTGSVEAIRPSEAGLKIPHMGWNELTVNASDHPVLAGIDSGMHAYFVHSYHAVCRNPEEVIATTDYGTQLTAIIARDHIIGTQFHPEKSKRTGLQLLTNFLKM